MITVAPTGAETAKDDAPALPVTLDELVQTAQACEAAGAAMIHVHIRDADAAPTLDPVRLKDTVAALREQTHLVVQLSTGGSVRDPYEARLAVLDAEPDSCSLTCGTVNFGDDVFLNPWPFMVELYQRTQAAEVVPEFELFDLGHVTALNRLLDTFGAPVRRAGPLRPRPGGARWHARDDGGPGGRRPRAAGRGHLVGDRASGGPRCRSRWRRCPPAATCGWAWRTPSPTLPTSRCGTTPSWSSGRPSWPGSRCGRR